MNFFYLFDYLSAGSGSLSFQMKTVLAANQKTTVANQEVVRTYMLHSNFSLILFD